MDQEDAEYLVWATLHDWMNSVDVLEEVNMRSGIEAIRAEDAPRIFSAWDMVMAEVGDNCPMEE